MIFLRPRLLLASAFVPIVVVACSSSDDAPPPDDGFAAFAKSYCAALVPCCNDSRRTSDDCAAVLGASKSDFDFDRAKGDACVAELQSKRGTAALCANVATAAPSCSAALKEHSGDKKAGEACAKRGDCASSDEGKVTCTLESGGSVCELTIVGKEGDAPCVGTLDADALVEPVSPRPARGFTCAYDAGLYCDRAKGACAKVGAVGSDCDPGTTRSCTKDAYCTSSSKCAARAAVGASCDGVTCVTEATCDGSTKKCVALASVGAVCQRADDCATHYCQDGHCATLDAVGDPTFIPVCQTAP